MHAPLPLTGARRSVPLNSVSLPTGPDSLMSADGRPRVALEYTL